MSRWRPGERFAISSRALEESLGILDLALCRKRFVVNMRAYADELITNQRLLLGIREGELKWTKVEEGKENEEITATINKATTKFDKWWIRQLLRTCETICAVTEFGGKTNDFSDKPATLALMQVYELLMTDHEEEILSHLSKLDPDDDAIAKAYQILPLNQAIHKLVDENIQEGVYVPAMFADVLIAMSTETTADNSLAQLKDATAWVPKQMRLMYKNMKQYYKDVNPEPTWVKEIKDQHAEDEEALETLGGSAAIAIETVGMSTFVMKLRIRYLVESKNLVYVACHVAGQVFHIVLYSDQNSGRNLSNPSYRWTLCVVSRLPCEVSSDAICLLLA